MSVRWPTGVLGAQVVAVQGDRLTDDRLSVRQSDEYVVPSPSYNKDRININFPALTLFIGEIYISRLPPM